MGSSPGAGANEALGVAPSVDIMGEATPGPGAYNQVEGGEAYSDMTRFGSRSLAKQSQVWASQVGRTSSTPREIDFVHKY